MVVRRPVYFICLELRLVRKTIQPVVEYLKTDGVPNIRSYHIQQMDLVIGPSSRFDAVSPQDPLLETVVSYPRICAVEEITPVVSYKQLV